MPKFPLALLASLALAGCASVPQPLVGTFPDVPLNQAAQATGTAVRWGGEVIETVPGSDHTCIYALARPLDRSMRPQPQQDSAGRFVACHAGFYDPEVFARGREITVTGTLDGRIVRKVGEYDYPYPRVAADTIYLWPQRSSLRDQPWDPFLGPYGWGPSFIDPYWAPPVHVIVVPPSDGSQ